MYFLEEHYIFLFLVQVFIILIFTRFFGELFRKIKQPPLTAEILVGVILGPTILGRFFPNIYNIIFPVDIIQQNMLETISWIGVLFLLLETGFEIDFSVAWRKKGSAFVIALVDVIVPMILSFAVCYFLPDSYLVDKDKKIIFALFMAVVMTISSMPIASRIMQDLKLLKTELGFLTMSALAVNDILGWILFTIILGLFFQKGIDVYNIVFVFLATLGFASVSIAYGRKLSTKIIDYFHRQKFPEPGASFTFACLLGLLFGAFTQKIGIHALFGFFIAGIVVGEAKNLKEETKTVINQMVHAFFVPIFFANIGLKIDFIKGFDWFLVLIITIIGIFSRYIGAYLGVFLAKVPKVNRNLISIAHTPGGMMEIVVALLAFEMGVITEKIFIAIIFSAVFSSVIVGIWMERALVKRKEVSILKYLDLNKGIFLLNSKIKESALIEILKNTSLIIKSLEFSEIKNEMIKREEDFSTAVGEEIAIPHVRVDGIIEPSIFFIFSEEGVDWNSPDGKLVHFIFFLVSPKNENDLHIEILSKIIKVIQISENRQAIRSLKNMEDISLKLKNIFS